MKYGIRPLPTTRANIERAKIDNSYANAIEQKLFVAL